MKKIIVFIVSLISLCFAELSTTTFAFAKHLEISKYDIEATVQENGNVDFVETIDFEASGRYNGVFYNLDISNKYGVENVSVEVAGRVLTANNSEEAETYQLTTEDGYLKYKVFLPMDNETKTVVFKYTLPHYVINYNDVAEFNRRVVGAKWEIDQHNITAHIRLPRALNADDLRAWGHGTDGTVTIDSDYQGVTYQVAENVEGSFVEAHIIFPTTVTPSNPHQVNLNAKEDIMNQEAELAQEKVRNLANIRRASAWWRTVALIGAGVSAVLAVFGSILPYRRWREKIPFVPTHLYEIPEPIPVMVMNSVVYGKSLSGIDFSAEVMDLIRKKIVRLTDDGKGLMLLVGIDTLSGYEQQLVSLFFRKAGKGFTEPVSFDDIEAYTKEHPRAAHAVYCKIKSEVNRVGAKFDVNDKKTSFSSKGGYLSLGVGVFSLLASLGSLMLEFQMWGLVGTVIGVVLICGLNYPVFQPRRTIQEEVRARQFTSLKQMMLDISSLDRSLVPDIVLWDELLVYATAFGIAKKVIQELKKVFPDEVLAESVFYSSEHGEIPYHYYSGLSYAMTRTAARSSVSPSSSSGSNSSGMGGSFSGGSSFGGGGGSGGGGF